MATQKKYTRQTSRTYPDPEGPNGYGVEVTAWTDEAWNNAQEARRGYLADLEWRRAHPYLARMKDAGTTMLDGIGKFVNDEILLNEGNMRVRNAQAHPDVLNHLLSAGNFTGGLVLAPFALGAAAETAPAWAPWLARTLATPKGFLAADATLTAGMTANQWMPWLLGGTAVASIPAGQYVAENGVPSISLPSFGTNSISATSAPTDSVGTPAANPPATPADSTRVAPAPTPPEPERNDSTSLRRPSFRERLGDRIAGRNTGGSSNNGSANGGATPPDNLQGSFLGRMLWETDKNNFGPNWWRWRNVGRVGLGFSYPAREHLWPAVGQGVKYMTVGPDSVPATPTATPAVAPTAAPVDSGYVAKDQYIAPTDTLDF